MHVHSDHLALVPRLERVRLERRGVHIEHLRVDVVGVGVGHGGGAVCPVTTAASHTARRGRECALGEEHTTWAVQWGEGRFVVATLNSVE